jgi:hypothetical protein
MNPLDEEREARTAKAIEGVAGNLDGALGGLPVGTSEEPVAFEFQTLWDTKIGATQRGELPRHIHFVFGQSTLSLHIPTRTMFGTLTQLQDGYAGDFMVWSYSSQGRAVDNIIPVSVSMAAIRQFMDCLFGIPLTNSPVPERDWMKTNLLRCVAVSSPPTHSPALFEFRSVWDVTVEAPWDFVHYTGWARDPEYGRAHNPVWRAAPNIEKAFSFLINAAGITAELDSLGFD